MTETEVLSLLKRYGNVSEEGFMMIRSNPKVHIDRLLKYPEAAHHIDYFNTRRAEMLPPNFKEADKGEFFNPHEIDLLKLKLPMEEKHDHLLKVKQEIL